MSDREPTPPQPAPPSGLRAEKHRALAALLGQDAMENLSLTPEPVAAPVGAEREGTGDPLSADRLRWHQNRLLERVRARLAEEKGSSAAESPRRPSSGLDLPSADPETKYRPTPLGFRKRQLLALADRSALEHEHPAVIAAVLRDTDRLERTELLRALPGSVSRAALRRLLRTS